MSALLGTNEALREALIDLERARRRELALREESEALLAGLAALAAAEGPRAAFAALLEALRAMLGHEHAFVLRSDGPDRMVVAWSTSPVHAESAWAVGDLFRRVLAGQPASVFDTSVVPEWVAQRDAVRAGCVSALHVPLHAPPDGAMLVCTHPTRGRFGPRHARFARRLATIASEALVRLDLARATVERDRLFDLSLDLICVTDAEGRVRRLNPAWARTLGHEERALAGRSLLDVVHPDDRPAVEAIWRAHSDQAAAFAFECRVLDAGDAPRWLLWSVSSFPEERTRFGVARDITARKHAEERAQHEALHDALTGLPNRTFLHEELARTLDAAADARSLVAVLYLDLDGFKPVNDRFGHDAGDAVLRSIADRIRSAVRDRDVVARHGGDEFVVILSGIATREEAFRIGRRVVRAVRAPVAWCGARHTVGASIGVALFPFDGRSPEGLLRKADAAMYLAKRAGGNRLSDGVEESKPPALDVLRGGTNDRSA